MRQRAPAVRKAAALLCGAAALVLGTSGAHGQARHPLDPLTWQEHWTLLEVLRDAGHYTGYTGAPVVELHEPPKAQVLAWTPGQPVPRAALAVLVQEDGTYEAVVDLVARRLVSYTHVPDAQPPWLQYEYDVMEADVVEHPEFIEAMRRRGITDLAFIDCGGVPPGYSVGPAQEGRIAHVVCHDARGVRNTWTRSIEGLVVVYDMTERRVLQVIDEEIVPVPATEADYDDASLGGLREPLPPIVISQPLGPGFRVDGHSVEWQDWSFHLRPDQRTGIIISTVKFRDGGRLRSVLYQGHLAEIFVPYMHPAAAWYTRSYLDMGDFSAGGLARPLQPGIDCPSYSVWFNQTVVADNGRPRDVPRVICLFERVTGDAVWVHAENGRPERELVARMTALMGNYDYIVDWVFRPDGSIHVSVGASGIPAVKMTRQRNAAAGADGAARDGTSARPDDGYGRFVADHILAVNHDHFFNFRLDLDVDGPVNRFQADRLVTERLPEDHPRRSAWVHREEVLRREQDARLSMDMHRPALWRVVSSDARNATGYVTSYQLVPGHNVHTLLSPDDIARRRAGFTDHQLWVTPYRAAERYPAGMYTVLSRPGQGLPAWTAGNRSIEDTDVVLWYTIGMHHVPRAEDWPVMPVSRHSFELRPFDFFDGNPALRLPRVP